MFKNFCKGGGSPKKPGPTPHKDKKASLPPLGEKKIPKRNPHDEKVAIAPPPWAPAGGGARVGGRPSPPPPTGKLKKNVC